MAENVRPPIGTFKGLNNISDPQRLPTGWLVTADNVDITDRGALTRCSGFTKRSTNSAVTGAYATEDLQRMYVVDQGELRQVFSDFSYRVLRTGLASLPMYFEEVNGQVFFTNGTDYGMADEVKAWSWGIPPPVSPSASVVVGKIAGGTYQIVCTLVDERGIESGNSPPIVVEVPDKSCINIGDIPNAQGFTTNVYVTARDGTVFFLLAEAVSGSVPYNCLPTELGRELPFWNVNAPRGLIPAHFNGQLYVAEPIPSVDTTVIWASLPMHFHHFDPGSSAISVPGLVRMLKATPQALIIGTDRHVWGWDGSQLAKLANYGVVPGWHASKYKEQLYFWTLRGLARAMPFENLTETAISVPPGLSAGGMVVEHGGIRRYVVALHKGGVAYNQRS